MAAVWDLEAIESTDKFVLLKLADHADDEGRNAWPSVETIARAICKSERTVQRALRKLERDGWIVVERAAGPKRPPTYRVIAAARGDKMTPIGAPRGDTHDAAGVTKQAVGVTPMTPRGDTHDTRSTREPSIEPSIDPPVARARLSTSRYVEAFGKKPTRALATALNDLDLAHPGECLDWAFAKAAGAARPNFNYAVAVLSACPAEGHGPREFTKGTYANGKASGPSTDALERYPVADGWQH